MTRDCDTGPGTWGEWEENGKRTAGRGSRCPGSGGKEARKTETDGRTRRRETWNEWERNGETEKE